MFFDRALSGIVGRKRRRAGDVPIIESPTPTNTTLVNRRMPTQPPSEASTERISRLVTKEEKIKDIAEYLRE